MALRRKLRADYGQTGSYSQGGATAASRSPPDLRQVLVFRATAYLPVQRRTDSRIQSRNEARGRPSARLVPTQNTKYTQEESDGGNHEGGSSSVPAPERVLGAVEE